LVESEPNVVTKLETTCSVGKDVAYAYPAWRCPHQGRKKRRPLTLEGMKEVDVPSDTFGVASSSAMPPPDVGGEEGGGALGDVFSVSLPDNGGEEEEAVAAHRRLHHLRHAMEAGPTPPCLGRSPPPLPRR
jgi:hypothetical protein